MKMEELSKPALDHVLNGDIKFYPPKFINTYRHWMENIRGLVYLEAVMVGPTHSGILSPGWVLCSR